jgi:hypothetical protein
VVDLLVVVGVLLLEELLEVNLGCLKAGARLLMLHCACKRVDFSPLSRNVEQGSGALADAKSATRVGINPTSLSYDCIPPPFIFPTNTFFSLLPLLYIPLPQLSHHISTPQLFLSCNLVVRVRSTDHSLRFSRHNPKLARQLNHSALTRPPNTQRDTEYVHASQ